MLEWAMDKTTFIPIGLEELVDAMCSPDPDHRPTAADALEEVDAMLGR